MLTNVAAIVLAGGQGTRLWPLTQKRAKPAVPIAGKFRLIDIAMSNCLHSDVRKMYVLTQFASESLHRHINQTYLFPAWSTGFTQILAAQQTMENKDWYQGTADAVRQNLAYLDSKEFDYYLILSGDHLYRMDYREMLKTHQQSGADVTVSVLPVSREKAAQFGVLQTDINGRISAFYEKPKDEQILERFTPDPAWLQRQGWSKQADVLLASMGIYIFSRRALFKMLQDSSAGDFGRGIFPEAIERYHVQAHYFDDYWEDIGTIRSFYDAMINLTEPEPKFDFYREDRPVYTHARFLPGARIDECTVHESVICDAARLDHATISKSIIGIRSRVTTGARLEHVYLMGADYMESVQESRAAGKIPLGVGENSIIEDALIDKNARIGRNVTMLRAGRRRNADEELFSIRDGILIVPKGTEIPDGANLQ